VAAPKISLTGSQSVEAINFIKPNFSIAGKASITKEIKMADTITNTRIDAQYVINLKKLSIIL